MSMVLEMPTTYRDVPNDELDGIDGGIGAIAVIGIIGGALGIGGSLYAGGMAAGERAYHAGLRNKTYQKIKWQVRGAVAGMSPAGSPFIMAGFENKFYSMI
ncbi:hypothetical protein ELQ90_00665 [Labedella phragmitis]|uniref:Uncharacterized protein n=2 Tax=Labedella TaxID=390250 RepID=A0A3S3ZVV5_9MICO|nr:MULTISPECIES: hypothetical protein [Labedella]RWZ52506.1 hypothetical protein ELQ90_00665 [Labedella phragmitis]RWZ67779.1 hypothetical protein ELQ92_00425 [Labedella populi]